MPTGSVYEFTDPGTSVDTAAGVNSGDSSSVARLKRAFYLLSKTQNLASYDKNGDGIIKPNELTLMVIAPGNLGAARSFEVKISNSLKYSGSGVSMGDMAANNTFAHELTHTVGTDDMYGNPSSGGPCNSDRMTPLSCSYTQTNEGYWGLDPWHLKGLGWDDRSEALRSGWVTGRGTPSQRTGWGANLSPKSFVKIPSPTRSLEYYVLEWRDKTPAWDKNVAATGVIAWYVAETSSGDILQIDSVTHKKANGIPQADKSNFVTKPTSGCLLDPWDKTSRGRAGALKQGKSYALKGGVAACPA